MGRVATGERAVHAAAHGDRAAVEKALSLLELVGEQTESESLSALARRAGLPKSTAFRLLGMLERRGAVVRVDTRYQIGPMLERLRPDGNPAALELIREGGTPFMADLYEQTHATVHLAVLRGLDVVYLNKLHGRRRTAAPSRIGGRVPAYATGVGKAILARDARALAITLASPRTALTARTLVDEGSLEAELCDIRERGVAYDRGESHDGVVCVAAPIVDEQGRAVAALSVCGTTGSFVPEDFEHAVRLASFAASRTVNALSDRARRTRSPDEPEED